MNKVIIACAAAALLAGCSSIPDTTEGRIIAACANERVKAALPHLCADPVATARNAETAKRVLRALVDLAL